MINDKWVEFELLQRSDTGLVWTTHLFPPPFTLAIFGQFELEHPHWSPRQWKYAPRTTTSSCSGHTFYSFCITFDSLKSHYWTLRCCWPYLHLQLLPLSAFQDVSIFQISFTRQTKHQQFCINDTKFPAPRRIDCIFGVLQLRRIPPAADSLLRFTEREGITIIFILSLHYAAIL